jgi:peptidoglycan-associated lipoprotein
MTRTAILLALALVLAFGAGCAKKTTVAEPVATQGKTVTIDGDGQDTGAQAAGQEDGPDYTQGILGEKAPHLNPKEQKQVFEEVQNMIFFDYDSYELKPRAREVLKSKARAMERAPKLTLIIEGHCDERGTEEYNLALGERRARAAYEFLVLLGVEPTRMSIVSYGEERPLAKGDNEAAWAQNRRDEFKLR